MRVAAWMPHFFGFTILTPISSVPSAKDVLVPETLLKKRKTDSKLREEKQAKAVELRKVCTAHLPCLRAHPRRPLHDVYQPFVD